MLLAIKGRRNRSVDTPALGYYGAVMAHKAIAASALAFNIVDCIYVLRDHTSLLETDDLSMDSVCTELIEEFGTDRVKITSLLRPAQCLHSDECILLAAGPEMVYQAAARQCCASKFPICSVLHSAKWDNLSIRYLQMAWMCEAHDALVTTSTAGRRAVERMLERSASVMAEMYGVRRPATQRREPMIVNIPLGVDPGSFLPRDKQKCRELLGIPLDSIMILYFGRIDDTLKADLEPLIISASRLIRRDQRILLVLAGQAQDDKYATRLEYLGSHFGLASNLRMITNLTPALKPILYSSADIFVSPVDNVQETFGLALLEAMSTGLPVIASDWSGYRDIVEDGKQGFLLRTAWSPRALNVASAFGPFAGGYNNEHYLAQQTVVDTEGLFNQLKLLTENPDLRCTLGAAGRRRVLAEFSWQTVAERLGALWLHQIAVRKQSHGPIGCGETVPLLDYEQVFGHYPTGPLTDNQVVAISTDEELSELSMYKRILQINNQILAGEVARLANCLCAGPQSIRELCVTGDNVALDAIVWLLKKGFCHVVGSG